MAEMFGTVASAAAVAELLVKSVLKIKKLWDEVQEAPEEITRLISKLELLSPVVRALETVFEQQKHLPSGKTAGPIIQACREVVGQLEKLAAELQNQISTARRSMRNIAKLKVTFKKDLIRVHHDKLEFIFQALSLSLQVHSISQQTHIVTLLESRPPVQLTQIIHTLQPGQPDASTESHGTGDQGVTKEASEKTHTVKNCPSRTKSQPIAWQPASLFGNFVYQASSHPGHANAPIRQVRVQLPWWLSRKAWDFQAYRACTGWKMSLKPWATRPDDAPIFQLIADSPWTEILQYVNEGHASVLDRREDGATLLHEALRWGRVDIARNLADLGLTVEAIQIRERSPLSDAIKLWRNFPTNDPKVIELFAFVASRGCIDDAVQHAMVFTRSIFFNPLVDYIWCIPGLFPLLAREGLPEGHRLSLQDRFASVQWFLVDPQVLLYELGHGLGVDPVAFRATVMSGIPWASLIEFAIQYFRHSFDDTYNAYPSEIFEKFIDANKFHYWRELARWIFTDITIDQLSREHIMGFKGISATPLLVGVMEYYSDYDSPREKRLMLRRLSKAMTMWLEDVQSSGVDLLEYGMHELWLYHTNHSLQSLRWEGNGLEDWVHYGLADRVDFGLIGRGPQLASLNFGPRPEDWDLVWDLAAEEYAGDFWNLIDNPHLHVPGEWTDDGPEPERYITEEESWLRCQWMWDE